MNTPNTNLPPNDGQRTPDDGDASGARDPNVALLLDYLSDELTPEAKLDFEQRLETDPVMAREVGSFAALMMLMAPPDLAAAKAAFGEATLDRIAQEIEAEQALEARQAEAWKFPQAAMPLVAVPKPGAEAGQARPSLAPVSVPPASSAPVPVPPLFPRRKWTVGRVLKYIAFTFLGFIGVLVALGFGIRYSSGVRQELGFQPSDSVARAVGAFMAADLAAGRTIVSGSGPLTADSTGPHETVRTAALGGAGTVTLRPGSRYVYRAPGTWLERLSTSGVARGTLDGEAVVDVSLGTVGIHNRLGIMDFSPGLYAVRALPHASEMLISVGRGTVTVRPFDGLHYGAPVVGQRGDYIRVPATGLPTVTHDSTGFPALGGDTAVRQIVRPAGGGHP